jgi:hypothetical protein
MKKLLAILIMILPIQAWAHLGALVGKVYDKNSKQVMQGVSVHLLGNNNLAVTNEFGQFKINNLAAGEYKVEATNIGYKTVVVSAKLKNDENTNLIIEMEPAQIQLNEVMITAKKSSEQELIGKIDAKLKPINNAQEYLRMLPGLVIGQHAGGGKAEQIFLRGFDIDHGTDIEITTDGMPVNMVSHAHGQGYADMHFIIPELVREINFAKGLYNAEKGNFATAGFVELNTKNAIEKNEIKLEAGQYDSYRALGIFNLLGEKSTAKNQSAYLASEYNFSNGYFDSPQAFNRINLIGKYHGHIGNNTILTTSISSFYSKWSASGQIPERAVANGQIGFFGAIDPSEGGQTSRNNLNLQLTTFTKNNGLFSNQFFAINYKFDLFSNFTFFLNHSLNGDQIRQKENRNIVGYNSSYNKNIAIANKIVDTKIGLNFRNDKAFDTELSATKNKIEYLNRAKLGDINETNIGFFADGNLNLTSKISINTGIRFDYFYHQYNDKLKGEKASISNAIISPKFNVNYTINSRSQLYFKSGKGFHSNDTRVVVAQDGIKTLPAAYGADLGMVFKPIPRLIVNPAIWYLWLNQEFIYVGDEGVVEPSGKTKRYGLDLSVRYQIGEKLYFDLDYNTTKPRAIGVNEGDNYLPLAPINTSTYGLVYQQKNGISASIRGRYVGNRPANENYSIIAKGYLINDFSINYTKQKYTLGLFVQNMFNAKWKETQFATESRLFNEKVPVNEIHFTPGTPFLAKLNFSINF